MFEDYYKYDNITHEEEKKLFKNLNEENRNIIINSHLKMVLGISKKYSHLPHSVHLDVVQSGIVGLVESVNKFKPEKGVRFSTFCRYYIKNKIIIYLRNYSDICYIPIQKKYKIMKKQNLNIFFDTIKTKFINNYLETDISEKIDKQIKIQDINKKIEDLNNYEKNIIQLRYEKNMSWRDIGKNLKLSHEKVRQDHNRIISDIKKSFY